MIPRDSDHLTVLRFRASERAVRLADRLRIATAEGPIGTTVVDVEEAMRGWIAKERSPADQDRGP